MFVQKQFQIPPNCVNKRFKIKISQGSMPPDPPSLLHDLHTDTYLPLVSSPDPTLSEMVC